MGVKLAVRNLVAEVESLESDLAVHLGPRIGKDGSERWGQGGTGKSAAREAEDNKKWPSFHPMVSKTPHIDVAAHDQKIVEKNTGKKFDEVDQFEQNAVRRMLGEGTIAADKYGTLMSGQMAKAMGRLDVKMGEERVRESDFDIDRLQKSIAKWGPSGSVTYKIPSGSEFDMTPEQANGLLERLKKLAGKK